MTRHPRASAAKGYEFSRLGAFLSDVPSELRNGIFRFNGMSIFSRPSLRLPLINWDQVAPRPEARDAPTTRKMNCPHCGEELRVALRAINTRCTACHKHLLLEDIVLRGDSVRTRIVTCGSILLEPSARFTGMLQGAEVVVAGRVMGTVIGTERVRITSTGKVAGTIATRNLEVDDQALIDGEINILNPDNTVSTSVAHG